jgi:hypothetical protein
MITNDDKSQQCVKIRGRRRSEVNVENLDRKQDLRFEDFVASGRRRSRIRRRRRRRRRSWAAMDVACCARDAAILVFSGHVCSGLRTQTHRDTRPCSWPSSSVARDSWASSAPCLTANVQVSTNTLPCPPPPPPEKRSSPVAQEVHHHVVLSLDYCCCS